MKVLFDDQAFSSQRHGGISNYFAQLIRQFETEGDLGIEPIGLPIVSFNQHLAEVGKARRPSFSALERRRALQAINATQNAGRAVAGRLRPDVIHYTHYRNTGWGGRNRKAAVTITVHDMMPELFPEDFGGVNPHFNKDYHIRNADSIACVSLTTKIDLMRLYPALDVPIVVTPLGVSPDFVPAPNAATESFFLFVGKRGGYKNFELFVKAASAVIRDGKIALKLVGGGPITQDERQLLVSAGIADRVQHCSPTLSELVSLYQRSIALVFPSRYEGFGLPTLEAMASGCPVIIGPTAALLEVAGDAAVQFEEFSVDSLSAAMRQVLESDALREKAKAMGLTRCQDFGWSTTARKTAECYSVAVGARR